MILLVIAIGSLRSAQANEVSLSDLPITNLIAQIDHFQNPVEGTNEPVTLEFTIVNDSPEEIFWHLRSEVLRPLMFAFYIEGQEDPIFQSPFGSRGKRLMQVKVQF